MRVFNTAQVNAETVGVRSGTIEGFYAADTAEKVLCRSRAELIISEAILSVKQAEVFFRHDQM